jgi:DNA-binding NtrC family response regulator
MMNPKNPGSVAGEDIHAILSSSVEDMIEKKLDAIATILCTGESRKSSLHEEVMSMVERSLFRIALKRSNHIKSAAASYLGINRNTFQNKMLKLGINCQKNGIHSNQRGH